MHIEPLLYISCAMRMCLSCAMRMYISCAMTMCKW